MTKQLNTPDATSIPYYLFGFAFACLLTACVTYPTVGSEPGVIPPKLVLNPTDNSVSWDEPSAFGPVPANLAVNGEATCTTLNTKDMQYEAIGYHPNAEGLDGKPFPAGGYFCAPKSKLETAQSASADAPITQSASADAPRAQKISADAPKAPTINDGWKSPIKWKSLTKGYTVDEIKSTIGEPITKVTGGNLATWHYPYHGYVTFKYDKVYSLGEPRFPEDWAVK